MQLVARVALGLVVSSTIAAASSDPYCPTVAVDPTAQQVCAAEAAVRDAQASLAHAEALLAAAQAPLPHPALADVSPHALRALADPGPHAGSLAFDVSVPYDVTFAPHQTLTGLGGVQLGVGYRASRRIELGWTADLEGLLSGADNGSDPSLRLRSGVQARYLFGVHDTARTRVLFAPWLGARAGFERLDGDTTTHGYYGDLSLGVDWWIRRQQFGFYASIGMSVEPATAYASVATTALTAQPEPPPSVPMVASPYVALAYRWGFW
jgi:hypothetical protein